MDKNILIVASTSELAQKTIEQLRKKDFKIYATSRHAAGLADPDVIEFKLDVTQELDFIHLKEKFSNLKFDTIINFAGIAVASAVEELDENSLKHQLDVNLFGLLRVIKYFCPLLQEGGKLINISSMASYGIFPFISPYCISKASCDILLNSYSIESGVKTVSIRPGAVATKFWDASINLNKEYIERKSEKFEKEKKFLLKNANSNSLHALNPIYAAQKIAKICVCKNPKSVYNIGSDAKIAKLSRFFAPCFVNSLIKFVLNKRIRNEKTV